MLFLALFSSILNIARHQEYVLMGDNFVSNFNGEIEEAAYLPPQGRIESYNQDFTEDCTLKNLSKKLPEKPNNREKSFPVVMLN